MLKVAVLAALVVFVVVPLASVLVRRRPPWG